MAIAGVKPVAFATSELGSMEDAVTSITDNTMKPISLPSGTALYTEEQVHEILVKFGLANDIDHIAATESKTLNEFVDEFMESDGE
ncbi:hypothetical protein [Weissella confusa]|uniref:hypothetical protein n=1 Tax=Weissella confusa TaxID=1583 RepID=UPI0022E2E89E|nr:hypothetical protein [Weissella confusa]